MASETQTNRRKKRTFIEEARREQIINVTIETVAAQGFSSASLSEIAKQADVSKGVISYHFDSKDELIEETIGALLVQENTYIKSRVDAEETAAGKLRAYITGTFEYIQSNPANAVAMWELWGSFDSAEQKKGLNSRLYEPCRRHLESIFRLGQRTGEFRPFPMHTAASVIQAAIDGIWLQWVFEPGAIDLGKCRAEILKMVEPYTQAEPEGGDAYHS
jgi:TetR/AcrR family fatty acid metabolism transcriptional regulator